MLQDPAKGPEPLLSESPEEPKRNLAYNPALDGLRAVSVLAIMVYHGGTSLVQGGFLAVDIFFVLSGFLITTLLLIEYENQGRIDLKAFWGARARRLLPALFLVLVAVLLYGAFLSGEAANAVRRDALATLFYVSNWWFIVSGNSYFEQFQDPSPLTHTWTLAIEEQWYLLLPIVLVLLLPRLRSRRALAIGFGLLALLSAIEMAWLFDPEVDPSRVYYGTDTRLQALLVGATAAAVLTPGVLGRLKASAKWLGPLAALLLLGFMLIATDRAQWLYRGGFLVMAAGVALLVATVTAHPSGWTARALSVAPLVWVGKISYGLYLWHWPVYVLFSPARVGMQGMSLLILRFSVTFAIAALSYYLVEMPIRRGGLNRLGSGQRLAVAVGAPVAILALMGATAATTRPPAPDSLEAIRDSATAAPTASPSTTATQPDQDVRAILVGDSVALSLFAAFPGDIPGFSVLPGTEFGCGLVPFEAAVNGTPMPFRPECKAWEEQRASRIAASGANLGVLFAGPWEQYDRWIDGRAVPFTDPKWKEETVNAYARVIAEMTPVTERQAVVLNTCHGAPDIDLPDAALYQAGRFPAVVNDPARIAAVNEAVTEAVRRSGRDIPIIDPNPFLCDADAYRSTIDGVQMHTDGVHFTEQGAGLYWEWLGPRLLKAGREDVATPSPPAP